MSRETSGKVGLALLLGLVVLGESGPIVVGNDERSSSSRDTAPRPDPIPPAAIKYINPVIPKIQAPENRGQYYPATTPATLDLAERARLALNCLTRMRNPNCDYELYALVNHLADPPRMYHWGSSPTACWDLDSDGKFLGAIPLLRSACGSDQGLDIEYRLMQISLMRQGRDGMIYVPATNSGMLLTDQRPMTGTSYGFPRLLGVFGVYAEKDPDGPWLQAARSLAAALKKRVTVEEEIAHLGKPGFRPVGTNGQEAGWLAQELIRYDRRANDIVKLWPGESPNSAQDAEPGTDGADSMARLLRASVRHAEVNSPSAPPEVGKGRSMRGCPGASRFGGQMGGKIARASPMRV